MKGISEILAIIMIVIVVVALIGLTYTFATGLFSTTTTTATTSVSSTTQKMDKRVSFAVPELCVSNSTVSNITFSIKHEGSTYKINDASSQNEMAVMIDSIIVPASNVVLYGTTNSYINETAMSPGEIKTFVIYYANTTTFKTSHKITVIAPASPMTDSFVC